MQSELKRRILGGVVACLWGVVVATAAGAQPVLGQASFNLVCQGSTQQTPYPAEYSCSADGVIGEPGPPKWEETTAGWTEAYAGVPVFDPKIPLAIRQKLQSALGDEEFILLASVQTEATVTTTVEDEESDFTHSTTAHGLVNLAFEVGVEQTATPPIPLEEVPVKIRIVGEANVTGNANSFALLLADGTLGVLRWEQLGPGSLSVEEVVDTEFFWIGDTYLFSKDVQCQAVTDDARGWVQGDTRTASCFAVIDPIFELDQARFDALAGPLTFPLADYYAIRYSSNLPVAGGPPNVPSLELWGLIALAGVLMGASMLAIHREANGD